MYLEFQFLIGTLKTGGITMFGKVINIKFQFLIGTLKTFIIFNCDY